MAIVWTKINHPMTELETRTDGLFDVGYAVDVMLGVGVSRDLVTFKTHISAAEILEDTGLPKKFDPHPELANTVLLSKKLIARVHRGRARVALIWGPNPSLRYRGARLFGSTRSQMVAHYLPYITQIGSTLGGAPVMSYQRELRSPAKLYRAQVDLKWPVFVNGDPKVITRQLAPSLGRRYTFPTVFWGGVLPGPNVVVPWVLVESTCTEGGALNQCIVTYAFRTLGPVPGIGAGTIADLAVALPPLDYAQEYDVDTRVPGAPVVRARDCSLFYFNGGPLPGIDI